ncbi:MAG: response regulator [Candidatus Thiodiazotropha endolucinida]|nr:response regulator [Candidatus Thiodiazotropha sp. (ex Lucina pensylvanica)]MCG7875664.1 response regulator [Candidatus Thiodiazotropha taylori]MCG8024069.1 response regulator [Candidatus Thiodiazotropha endolucinida]MCG7881032.1 response regulator [Candidatus Thiodiazotropha taylori]MCG7885930.1 response regulator [Candidatus Thiodiazotropha taylori]
MSKQAFLVDDSKSARIVLSRMLKKSGFDGVEMAVSGEEALERLKESTPDAIFVDFLMDGMDGLETITEIKKDPRFSHTPVVMCTANEGDEYVQAAVEHGALGILAKPPTDESLGVIIDLIEQHQQEVAATSETAPDQAVEAEGAAEAVEPAAEVVVMQSGLSDEDVRRIAKEVALQAAEKTARQAAEEAIAETLADRIENTVQAYLDSKLEPMIVSVVERGLKEVEPQSVDTEALRESVVEKVNQDLDEFVRQLNQRTVGDLIEASIYSQMKELDDDISQRLQEQEQRILNQVPEKNDMIEHIRVITEGSLEAQVHETATRVAGEIANSVATETVENLLDQHLAHQALESQQQKSKLPLMVVLGLGLLAVAGAAAFMLL